MYIVQHVQYPVELNIVQPYRIKYMRNVHAIRCKDTVLSTMYSIKGMSMNTRYPPTLDSRVIMTQRFPHFNDAQLSYI